MTTNLDFPVRHDYRKYFGTREVQLDILLDIICQRLQLDKTRESNLQSAYTNITKCIENNPFFDERDAKMYAFGSRALNTVTKSYKRKEYDLDFAIQILLKFINISPEELIGKLYKCLNSNGNFEGKLEKIRYGVRVKYAGQFHVDIMLGIDKGSDRLLVPDWKDNVWVNRNPKGYIKWFEDKYLPNFKDIRLYEYYRRYYPQKFDRRITIEAKAEIEDITPAAETYADIQPIQRITQLVKRHRDIFFLSNSPEYKTSSIILTTLIGDYYNGATSIYEGMNKFISENLRMFELYDSHTPFDLINPADRLLVASEQENLTDKWQKDKMYYRVFRQYIRKLQEDWNELHNKSNLREQGKFLQTIFGENVVRAAYEALNEHYRNLGLKYDNQPLPNPLNSSPSILSQQTALANITRNRKPYYK